MTERRIVDKNLYVRSSKRWRVRTGNRIETEKAIRSDIENIIARYADGTFLNGLKDAWWIEYGEPGPQECADELVKYIIKLLGETK
jgi:hypothetical protein